MLDSPAAMSQEVFNPEWVSACLQGDQLAWETLVRHFAPLVHSIPRRLGLTPEESDDVFQTSFTILYQRLASIDDPQSLPKWITTTTTRECWRTLRRRRKSRGGSALSRVSRPPAGRRGASERPGLRLNRGWRMARDQLRISVAPTPQSSVFITQPR